MTLNDYQVLTKEIEKECLYLSSLKKPNLKSIGFLDYLRKLNKKSLVLTTDTTERSNELYEQIKAYVVQREVYISKPIVRRRI